MIGPSSSTNVVAQNLQGQLRKANTTQMFSHTIFYGYIYELDLETRSPQCKVTYTVGGQKGQLVEYQTGMSKDDIANISSRWIPIVTPLEEVMLRFGPLRVGLFVMVHQRGKEDSSWGVAHIIGDENQDIIPILTPDEIEVQYLDVENPGGWLTLEMVIGTGDSNG